MPLNRRAPNLELELERVVERAGGARLLASSLPAQHHPEETGLFVSFPLCLALGKERSSHARGPSLFLIRRSLSPTSDVFSQPESKGTASGRRGRKPKEVSGPLTQKTHRHPSFFPPSHLPPLLQFKHGLGLHTGRQMSRY